MKKDLENLEKQMGSIREKVSEIEERLEKFNMGCKSLDSILKKRIGEVLEHTDRTKSVLEEAEETLKEYHFAKDDLVAQVENLPKNTAKILEKVVADRMEMGIKKGLGDLDAACEQKLRGVGASVEGATNEAASSLEKIRTSAEKTLSRLSARVGWKSYLAPAGCGVSGFCAVFMLVWWGDIGLRKISSKDMASLERVRTLYSTCSDKEQSQVLAILESAAQREITREKLKKE